MRLREAVIKVPKAVNVRCTGILFGEVEALSATNFFSQMRLWEAVVKVPQAIIVSSTGILVLEVKAIGATNVLREAALQRKHVNPPTGLVRLARNLILKIDAFVPSVFNR